MQQLAMRQPSRTTCAQAEAASKLAELEAPRMLRATLLGRRSLGRGGTGGAAAQGLHTMAFGGGGRLASPDVDMRLRRAVSGGFRACCGAGRGVAAGALGRWDFEPKTQAARRLLAAQASQAPLRPVFFGAC